MLWISLERGNSTSQQVLKNAKGIKLTESRSLSFCLIFIYLFICYLTNHLCSNRTISNKFKRRRKVSKLWHCIRLMWVMERVLTGYTGWYITFHLLWRTRGQIALHVLHTALVCIWTLENIFCLLFHPRGRGEKGCNLIATLAAPICSLWISLFPGH